MRSGSKMCTIQDVVLFLFFFLFLSQIWGMTAGMRQCGWQIFL